MINFDRVTMITMVANNGFAYDISKMIATGLLDSFEQNTLSSRKGGEVVFWCSTRTDPSKKEDVKDSFLDCLVAIR